MNQKRHAVPAVVLVEQIVIAIARHEGYWEEGSLSRRNNNPGNLRSWGAERQVDGFVQFMSAEEGFRALRIQVWKNVVERKLTLIEFFAGRAVGYPGYAPRSDGNTPLAYAVEVANHLIDYGISWPLTLPLLDYTSDGPVLEGMPYPGLGETSEAVSD